MSRLLLARISVNVWVLLGFVLLSLANQVSQYGFALTAALFATGLVVALLVDRLLIARRRSR